MTWREELRRVRLADGREMIGASFRGVPFFVDSGERSGGRRNARHEFPLADNPYSEDLGRRGRSFRLDGYVIGDDYLAERDALISALEDEAGPGELVHPYHGVLSCICDTFTVRESKSEGGIATFSIQFDETPSQMPTPTEVVDFDGQVDDSADAAIEAIDAEFVEKFDPEGMPAFALASAELAVTEALGGMASALSGIVTETQELAALAGRIEVLTAQASALVRNPASAVSDFRSVITGLAETVAAVPGAVMTALFDAYLADLGPPIVPTTSTRERELANQRAITGALRGVMAIEAARLAPVVPYVSIEEATAARDQVADILEDLAELAGDTAYPALVNLRSEVLRAVPGGREFARVVTVTPKEPTPSLVLAHRLYGSVDREQDIIARNSVRHPGILSGPLKVLSDG